jgi:hypothetical protein
MTDKITHPTPDTATAAAGALRRLALEQEDPAITTLMLAWSGLFDKGHSVDPVDHGPEIGMKPSNLYINIPVRKDGEVIGWAQFSIHADEERIWTESKIDPYEPEGESDDGAT